MFSFTTFFIVTIGILAIFFSFIPIVKYTSKNMRLSAIEFCNFLDNERYDEAEKMLHPKLLAHENSSSIFDYFGKLGLEPPLSFTGRIRDYNIGIRNGSVATYCTLKDGSHSDFNMDLIISKGKWVIYNIDKEVRHL